MSSCRRTPEKPLVQFGISVLDDPQLVRAPVCPLQGYATYRAQPGDEVVERPREGRASTTDQQQVGRCQRD